MWSTSLAETTHSTVESGVSWAPVVRVPNELRAAVLERSSGRPEKNHLNNPETAWTCTF